MERPAVRTRTGRPATGSPGRPPVRRDLASPRTAKLVENDDPAVPGHWQGDPAAVGRRGGEVPLQQIAGAGGELGGHGGAPRPAGHHASAAMTPERYGHLFGDELDAVADRMDAARADRL